MSRKKSAEKEIKGVQKILQLSDSEFEKWMDAVERAGIRMRYERRQ